MTNALSHERMTPLNSLINCSELLIHKCEKLITLKEKIKEISKSQNHNIKELNLLSDYKVRNEKR